MKIRFTKPLPWAEAGTEFEVFRQSDWRYIEVALHDPFHGRDSDTKKTRMTLHELEGWYEVVRWKPKEGEFYLRINIYGEITCGAWEEGGISDWGISHAFRYNFGNCFPASTEGRKQAEAKAEQIRAILKEGE
jgi:hypothetical protein